MPNVTCTICDKSFYTKPFHVQKGWGKYCSIACRTKGQFTRKKVACFICAKEVYRQPKELRKSKSGKYFCSKTCQTIWRNKFLFAGENHPNWLEGESSYRETLKRTNKKQTCTLCNTDDVRVLAVHHRDKNRKNNNLDNLIWICHNCHYLVHHFDEEKQKLNNIMNKMVVVVQQ